MDKKLIDALLEERRGYVLRGKKDRVAEVDRVLSALGYRSKETASVEPEVETATAEKPRKRKV